MDLSQFQYEYLFHITSDVDANIKKLSLVCYDIMFDNASSRNF
jgi:hypothetical protein